MSDPFKNKVEDLKKVLHGKKKSGETAEAQTEAPPENQGELEALSEKLKGAEEEAKQNYEKLLRTVAEFDNYKKRAAREQEDRSKYSLESFLKELLPVLDDFERVMEHLPSSDSKEIKGMTEGVSLLHRHFMSAMKKFNLEEVKTKGEKFDPHLHEALNQEESDEDEGTILTCHRKGYRLYDRLLRPALVTIAKPKSH